MTEAQHSNDVSVRATITDSGLSVAARSRAITALDRLLGGFIGIPAALLERIHDRLRNQSKRESIVQEAAANRLRTAISNDEEITSVIADMALRSRLGPIINKMRVAELAVDELSEDAATQNHRLIKIMMRRSIRTG